MRLVYVMVATMILAAPVGAHAAVPCRPAQYTLNIYDEAAKRQPQQPDRAIEDVQDAAFRQFVATVTNHLLSRFGMPTPAKASEEDRATVRLVFLRRPLLRTQGALEAPIALPSASDAAARQLLSPWVRLVLGPPPACAVHAIVHWNERQFLRDQALLAGATVDLSAPPTPLSEEAFARFAEDYAESVVREAAPERREQALAALARRLPAELLWLFRHAPQSTRGPFANAAHGALHRALAQAGPGHAGFVNELLDLFLAAATPVERVDSVLALRDFDFDRYRIDRID